MAHESKLLEVKVLANGAVTVSCAHGVFGEVLTGQTEEFIDVGQFAEALQAKEDQLNALLCWVPLMREKRVHPGDMNALLALTGKRVVFDTDPGQTPFLFPA